MSSVSDKTVIRARAVPASLKLNDWPLRDEPWQSVLLLALTMGSSVAAAVAAQHYAMGLVTFGLFSVTLRRLWLPTTYELNSKGVVLSRFGRRRRVPWTEFVRYEVHKHGIMLCSDLDSNALSAWRGIFIRCRDNRDELLSVIEFYLQGPATSSLLSTRSISQVGPPPTPAQ